jgi:hypothetical protein
MMSVMAAWTFALVALSGAASVGDAPIQSVWPRGADDAVSSAVASARDELKESSPLPACSARTANVTFGPSEDPTHAVPGGGPAVGAFCGGPGVSFGPGFGIHLLERNSR